MRTVAARSRIRRRGALAYSLAMRGVAVAALVTCGVQLAPPVARGQEASEDPTGEVVAESATEREARAAYDAGAVAFDEGRYSVALESFQRSHELSGRPALLYNIGLCFDRLRRDREALEAFEAYREAEPDTPHRRLVDARIAALRTALAQEERAREEQEAAAAARAAQDGALAASDEEEPDGGGSLLGEWWFWTVVGVVVLGGAAAAIGLAASGDRVQEPLPGTQGAVFATLTFGP